MSTRTHLSPYVVFKAVDMSLTQTVVTILKSLSIVSYEFSWAGSSPSGNITVQISNSYKQNSDGSVLNPGIWNILPVQDVNGSILTSVPVSGNTGSDFIDVKLTGGNAIRLQYVPISGTGALTAYISGKVA